MEGQNGTLVFARMRDCACPGTPHEEGDGVYLHPTVSLRGGMALEEDMTNVAELFSAKKITEDEVGREIRTRWSTTAIRYETAGWNLVAEDGVPVPFDVNVILNDYNLGRHVADRAAELYTDPVLVPLVERLNGLSRNGSAATSTSPTAQSTRKPRRQSSRATSAATRPSSA